MTILIREEYTNVTKNCRFGDSGEPHEAFTDDIGVLFRDLKREYGKANNVYIDTKSVRHIGWTFTKRMKYEDARTDTPKDHYIREVWVTQACISHGPNGAVTRHPFTQMDIDDYRKRNRKAASTKETKNEVMETRSHS
jgi:hypothetical protein